MSPFTERRGPGPLRRWTDIVARHPGGLEKAALDYMTYRRIAMTEPKREYHLSDLVAIAEQLGCRVRFELIPKELMQTRLQALPSPAPLSTPPARKSRVKKRK